MGFEQGPETGEGESRLQFGSTGRGKETCKIRGKAHVFGSTSFTLLLSPPGARAVTNAMLSSDYRNAIFAQYWRGVK